LTSTTALREARRSGARCYVVRRCIRRIFRSGETLVTVLAVTVLGVLS